MSILIFPEGTRSTDGSMSRFHSGAARLARDFGIPVLPVALVGTREIMPNEERPAPLLPRRGTRRRADRPQ